MPIIRLTKTDPGVAVTNPEDDMILEFVGFDELAYNFNWTGRTGLLPLSAVQTALNRTIAGKDFRAIWIATDGKFPWGPNDQMQILSSRLQPRLDPTPHLSHEVKRIGLASPYDRISFAIDAKPSVYSIDIYINPLADGDSGHSEYMQVNSN